MIKKIYLTVAVLAGVAFPAVAAQQTFAVDVIGGNGSACNNPNATSKPAVCSDNATNGNNPIYGKGSILTSIISLLAKFVGVVSTIIIVISGVRMTVAQDPNAASLARRGLISAIVGLMIALIAQSLVSFVLNKL